MIVVEAANVNPDLPNRGTRFVLGAYDDKLIPALRQIADAIHEGGSKTFLQGWMDHYVAWVKQHAS